MGSAYNVNMKKTEQIKNCWNGLGWADCAWWAWPMAFLLFCVECTSCLIGFHRAIGLGKPEECINCRKSLP